MHTPDLGGEALVLVPTSVEELGIQSELAEQAEEKYLGKPCFLCVWTLSEHDATRLCN